MTSDDGTARTSPPWWSSTALVVGGSAVLVLLAVLLVPTVWETATGCADPDSGNAPADVGAAALALADEVGRSPAVASVAVSCWRTVDEAGQEQWRVQADVVGTGDAEVPAAARALADAADPSAPVEWWLGVATGAGDLQVDVLPGGDVADAQAAVEVRATPGVERVRLVGTEDDRTTLVTVASCADLPGGVAATADAGLPDATVEVQGLWLEVAVPAAGAPAPDVVALAVEVAGWPEVYRVGVSGGGGTGERLDVDVTDDVDGVADRLDAAAGDVAGEAQYDVSSDAAHASGLLGASAVAADVPDDVAADEEVRACTGDELTLTFEGTDAAAGRRFAWVGATSTASEPCRLQGMPGLGALRESGTPVPGLRVQQSRVRPLTAEPVVLAPGGRATAELQWGAMSTSLDPDVTVALVVVAVPDGPEVTLPVSSAPVPADTVGPAPTSLDILEGATVDVGDWQAAEG